MDLAGDLSCRSLFPTFDGDGMIIIIDAERCCWERIFEKVLCILKWYNSFMFFFTGRIIILDDVYIVLKMFRSESDEAEE